MIVYKYNVQKPLSTSKTSLVESPEWLEKHFENLTTSEFLENE
jgi:hypothetical protein